MWGGLGAEGFDGVGGLLKVCIFHNKKINVYLIFISVLVTEKAQFRVYTIKLLGEIYRSIFSVTISPKIRKNHFRKKVLMVQHS